MAKTLVFDVIDPESGLYNVVDFNDSTVANKLCRSTNVNLDFVAEKHPYSFGPKYLNSLLMGLNRLFTAHIDLCPDMMRDVRIVVAEYVKDITIALDEQLDDLMEELPSINDRLAYYPTKKGNAIAKTIAREIQRGHAETILVVNAMVKPDEVHYTSDPHYETIIEEDPRARLVNAPSDDCKGLVVIFTYYMTWLIKRL